MARSGKLLHGAILTLCIFVTLQFLPSNVKTTHPQAKLYLQYSNRFLTKWTYVVQMIHYSLLVLAHILSSVPSLTKVANKLYNIADLLFGTIVIPVGAMITIGFWTLYNINREYIFPSWIDQIYPNWLNHCVHTLNSILPLMDMLLVRRRLPGWKAFLICNTIYMATYNVVFLGTYFSHGIWLYPVYNYLSGLQCGLLITFLNLSTVFFYTVARAINYLRWGPDSVTQTVHTGSKQKSKRA